MYRQHHVQDHAQDIVRGDPSRGLEAHETSETIRWPWDLRADGIPRHLEAQERGGRASGDVVAGKVEEGDEQREAKGDGSGADAVRNC